MTPLITYAGIQTVTTASFALSLGTMPSVATLTIAPQDPRTIPREGPLRCEYRGQVVWELPRCRVDFATSTLDASGHVATLSVLDRRWAWRFGAVFGEYNIRDESGGVTTWSQKTPARLAEILCEAMGESDADVSALDGIDDFPQVKWTGEVASAALTSLCERYGRRVAYGLDDRVRIVTVGEGPLLPITDELQMPTVTLDASERPAYVRVVGGPTLFQRPLPLRAVGLDVDGAVRPINELSYRPARGWGVEPESMPNVASAAGGLVDEAGRTRLKLALQTVHRWFQIDVDAMNADPQTLPPQEAGAGAGEPIGHLASLLPIGDELLETDPITKKPKRSRVFGYYWIRNSLGRPANSTATENYVVPWDHSLIAEQGIVVFDTAVRQWYALGSVWIEPQLWIECTFHRRFYDPYGTATNDFHRFARIAPVPDEPADSTRIETLVAEDLVRRVRMVTTNPTSDAGTLTTEWVDNDDDIEPKADELLAARVAKYRDATAGEGRYVGLLRVEPSGSYQQVSWEVGDGGAFTTVSLNTETNPFVPTYKTRARTQLLEASGEATGQKLFSGGLFDEEPKMVAR